MQVVSSVQPERNLLTGGSWGMASTICVLKVRCSKFAMSLLFAEAIVISVRHPLRPYVYGTYVLSVLSVCLLQK